MLTDGTLGQDALEHEREAIVDAIEILRHRDLDGAEFRAMQLKVARWLDLALTRTPSPSAQPVAWREALEAAARICESVNNYDNPMTAGDCAAAIRDLIAHPAPSAQPDAVRQALAELVACKDLNDRALAISPVEPGYERDVLMEQWRKRIPNAWKAARAALASSTVALEGEQT